MALRRENFMMSMTLFFRFIQPDLLNEGNGMLSTGWRPPPAELLKLNIDGSLWEHGIHRLLCESDCLELVNTVADLDSVRTHVHMDPFFVRFRKCWT